MQNTYQLFIHGQWWSILETQRLHIRQWWDNGGLKVWHKLHGIVFRQNRIWIWGQILQIKVQDFIFIKAYLHIEWQSLSLFIGSIGKADSGTAPGSVKVVFKWQAIDMAERVRYFIANIGAKWSVSAKRITVREE